MKDIFNKRQRFSIRKLSFGVFSALLGVVLFGSPQEVLASTENNLTSSIESSSEIVNSITTVEKKEEVQNNSENRGNVSKLAPKDMSGVATRAAELREPGDKENNRTVKPTFVSGRDRSSNPETRASAPSSDIKKYELTEEYAKQIKSGEIGLEGNKLDSLLLDGPQLNPNGFTDNDYLMDKDEIYIYEKNGKKYVGYNSHPLLEDTDGDGIIDSKEKTDEKLKWNVSERDMIMFMELAYRDDDYIDKVLNHKRPLSESELFKRNSDKKPRYEYMMMNKELGPYWERKKSYHTPSGLDAVLFETKSDFPFLPNGTAQILAFRGTSDAKDIKADVTLGIGGNPQQGIDAENIISELAKDKSITNLYLTGHSLGGYLVQRAMVEAYQLAYSDRRVMTPKENVVYRNFYNNILKKGTTFNAPKVVTSLVSNSNFWQKGLDSKTIAKSGKITHYIVDNDQTIKKGVSNDSDVVINVGSTSGGHSSRSYFENDMINRRREFISGKRISLDGIGYQDKNISTIKSVEKVGEKIVYSKNGDDIFKLTTISIKDSDTGKVTENVINEIFKKDGLKDKVDVETIQSPIKYVKDTTREKGQENITVPGKAGSTTTTTTYTVNRETGEVTSNVGKPVIVAPTTTIIKVAAKDKVEVVQRKNGKKVKVTTVYTVDEKTGNITQIEREEEISREVITSKSDEKVPTIELKPFEGGVNPVESVVTEELKPFEGGVNGGTPAVKEELPELKLALLKDEEGNILDVLAISEKPKELNGYKYTGKEKEDSEGNKIYVYQKDNSEVVTSKSDEKVPTIELKPFEGGVNPEESVVTEELKPFEGGVNPEESVVTEELKPFEGGVNPVETVVTEELKPFEGGVNPEESVVTEELKPYEGGVNPEESVVTEEPKPFEDGEIPAVKEELPELKLALLKDEEGNILDVLAISEKPKELSGYKYTGKEKLDSEGNKIYIYQKVELENINNKKQDTIVVNQSQNIESQNETTAARKIQTKKLSNTGETPLENGLLGGMLLAATMMLAKRKKNNIIK